MQALLFDKKLRLANVNLPERRPGEALIQVSLAGICNTDLEIMRGYMDFTGVPGHEFVGVVKESDKPSLAGKRVVGEINAGCGDCELCRSGDPRHCPSRTVLGISGRNGAFAEYLTIPETNLHVVPDNVPDTAAVFTEPLAAALQIFDEPLYELPKGTSIAVIGDGKLGLLVGQAALAYGYTPVLFGKNKRKLSLAASWRIRTYTAGDQNSETFSIVIECSGEPSGLKLAMNIVEPKGIIILKSTYAADAAFDLSPIVINEISLAGSRCGNFPPALQLLEENIIDTNSLITAMYPLSEGLEAFRRAGEKDSLKILLKIND
ncbi:hypothetical protein AMJ80_02755 [bacterium SM23_31]|nr:MAG: hypothetical protein AMJ80_02755 [bacterium SM23_31]